jgi:hypothetical protein
MPFTCFLAWPTPPFWADGGTGRQLRCLAAPLSLRPAKDANTSACWLMSELAGSGVLDHGAAELAHDQVRPYQVATTAGSAVGVRPGIVGEFGT